MENYILRYEHNKVIGPIRWEVEVDWVAGINICIQLTKQLEEEWTRHPSVEGPSRPTGQYWDLYNEGSLILVPIKQRSLLLSLKRRKVENNGKI